MALAPSCSTESHDHTKSDFDRPILITGCARSRTSMVAGVINRCGVWGGDMFGSAPGNPSGFYENKALRERLVKPLLQMIGADPLGVHPLPPEPDRKWGKDIHEAARTFLDEQGYAGEQWMYKGAKMAYLWPAWDEAFPDAKWVIVRRDREEIIDSCLRTHFMNQHSQKREFWERWVDETEQRLEEMKRHVDYVEVWPPDGLREMVDSLGLEWTEDAEQFISDPFRSAEPIAEISTANPVPDEQICRNIRKNLERDIPRINAMQRTDEPLIIVGGGPSLARNLDRLRKKKGKILAVNGVHDYLVEHGIHPWGMIMLDPRDDMGKFAGKPRKCVKYLIASQVDPQVFDRLQGFDVRMWHAYVGAGEKELLESTDEVWTLLGGGSTCGIRAFHLGMVMGFRKFHCFGMDSCLDGTEHHAYEQDIRKSGLERVVTVHANGTEFMATGWMFAQARDFNDLLTAHGDKFSVTFHGGGLLAHVAAEHPNRR